RGHVEARAVTSYIFHLIPHTHWDREWYLPRAAFHARLVAMFDVLLERRQADGGFRSFLLDGQTILVEDYLRARPERDSEIKALVKTGRLQVGPWYVLADELIPSGESLIRNLLLGAADAERLGGRLDVLYSPDAFGHPAVLPSLAREFGIKCGVLWRGLVGGVANRDRNMISTDGAPRTAETFWSGICRRRATKSARRYRARARASPTSGRKSAPHSCNAPRASISPCSSGPITTRRIRRSRVSATCWPSSSRQVRFACRVSMSSSRPPKAHRHSPSQASCDGRTATPGPSTGCTARVPPSSVATELPSCGSSGSGSRWWRWRATPAPWIAGRCSKPHGAR